MRSKVQRFSTFTVYQARQLRKRMSPSEIRLWRVLRLRPEGLQFRKQHPFGDFVFDFFCKDAGVAVEVDGTAHDMGDNPARDQQRDRLVRQQGVETMRISAEDVRTNLDGVVLHIVQRCLERTPPPHSVRSPSPSNDGEDAGSRTQTPPSSCLTPESAGFRCWRRRGRCFPMRPSSMRRTAPASPMASAARRRSPAESPPSSAAWSSASGLASR
jgi:very-short-patch-repair endonuclease